MLGKLTKNSFKSTISSVYNIYIAMGVIGIIMLILLFVDFTKWGDTGVGVGFVIKIIVSAALCITAFVAVIMTFVAVFSEFSRNMYKDEGYLTMSLPVKGSTLLFSKWLSGSFWVLVSYVVLCLCLFCSLIYCVRRGINMVNDNTMYYSTYELIQDFIKQLSEYAGIVTPSFSVLLNLAAIYAVEGGIRASIFVLVAYFAMTLSHCTPFHRLGKIGPLLYFFGGLFAVFTFSGIITKLVKIYIIISDSNFTVTLSELQVDAAWKLGFGAYSVTNIYCSVIAAVFIFFITSLLIDRKVNVN